MKYKTAAMLAQENKRETDLMEQRDEKPALTAKDLKQALAGTINQRLEEDRAIVLTMKHGERPEVRFDGFWNGRLVKNAMNAISKGYRLRRHKQVRAHADVPNKGEGDA
jgi:hypothetical protein